MTWCGTTLGFTTLGSRTAYLDTLEEDSSKSTSTKHKAHTDHRDHFWDDYRETDQDGGRWWIRAGGRSLSPDEDGEAGSDSIWIFPDIFADDKLMRLSWQNEVSNI